MARASLTRRLLRRLSFADVKEINSHFDLQPRKSKDELISQIVLAAGTDLSYLVSAGGPFSLNQWNDTIEEIGGNRRKSFETAATEIESSLDPVYDDLDGDESIAEIRDDEASLRSLAEKLGCPRSDLEILLKQTHGGTGLASFVKSYRTTASKTSLAPTTANVARIRLASTRVTASSIEVLNQTWLKQFLAGADSISIAAGYYDVAFIGSLLQKDSHLKTVRLLFNGLGGQRLEAQSHELTELNRTLAGRFDSVEIKLVFAPGLFHTKLFLAVQSARTRAVVGSANATHAAFNKHRNEELVVALPDAGDLIGYFEAAWSMGHLLSDLDLAAKSLVGFFRTGVLYFKPTSALATTFNPFRELIRDMRPEDKVLLGAIALPHAEHEAAIGAFDLKKAVRGSALPTDEISEQEKDDESTRTLNSSIKPSSVETCYGYWVPSALDGALQEKLHKAGAQKEERLLAFRTALNAVSEAELTLKYEEYLSAVRQALQKLPNGPPKTTRDPYDLKAFTKFVAGIKRQLEDEDRRKRLTHPFVPGSIPELWDDAIAYEDFHDSFFEYLAHIAQRSTKIPNVPGKILKKIISDDAADAATLSKRLEHYIEVEGWTNEDWK